jgi:hypothetical protein
MAHSASTNLNQPGRRVAAAVFPWPMTDSVYASLGRVQGGNRK